MNKNLRREPERSRKDSAEWDLATGKGGGREGKARIMDELCELQQNSNLKKVYSMRAGGERPSRSLHYCKMAEYNAQSAL